jgi:plastocyanin
MKKLVVVLCLLALPSFGLVACGDDDEETTAQTTEETTATDPGAGGGGGGGTFAVAADPDGALAFTEDSASVPAGEVTVEFDNPAATAHDVVIEDAGGEELIATDVISQDTTSASGELEPGEYTFYCSVDNHRDAGMEGTLTVE